MKIQCSGCDAAEAKVFCCADEAALCLACDEKIHSANKLVSKHQRVPLSTSSSPLPKCDICQETFGYFICLEDRALLCRKRDVGIHTVNCYVSGHQRFLLSGVRVGLEFAGLDKSSPTEKLLSAEKTSAQRSMSRTRANSSACLADAAINFGRDAIMVEGGSLGTPLDRETGTKIVADWLFKDILELIDSSSSNHSSGVSKAAETKGVGNSEWWKILRSAEEELLNDNLGTSAEEEILTQLV